VDRFFMKVRVDYPSLEEEKEIIGRMSGAALPRTSEVLSAQAILKAQKAVDAILVSDVLKDYIVRLVAATRNPQDHGLPDLRPLIEYGASPRASLGLAAAARARAFLEGRGYAVPEDVKALAADVMRHRLILTYEAEAQNQVPVP
jgi:MoxR-like ATPase